MDTKQNFYNILESNNLTIESLDKIISYNYNFSYISTIAIKNIIKLELTQNHLLKLSKLNFILPYNIWIEHNHPENLLNLVFPMNTFGWCNIERNIEQMKQDLTNFMTILTTFSNCNFDKIIPKLITIPTLQDIEIFFKFGYNWFLNKENIFWYMYYYPIDSFLDAAKTKQFYDMLDLITKNNVLIDFKLVKRLLDFNHKIIPKCINYLISSSDVITNDMFIKLIKYLDSNTVLTIITKTTYIPLEEHLELLCSKEDYIDLFEHIKNIGSFPFTDKLLAKSVEHNNVSITKYLLENKVMPKEEYITKNTSNEIIKLFENYGLSISNNIHIMGFLYNTINKYEFDDKFKNSVEVVKEQAERKRYNCPKKINSVDSLKRAFRCYSLKQLETLDCKIKPDNECFVAALNNASLDVMIFLLKKYNFTPTILDIMRIEDLKNRYIILHKFYPQYASIQ
jgi:hypothetical protein